MSEITIRPARLHDSAEIACLMTELGYVTSTHEMEARLAVLLEHKEYITNVALVGQRTVGIAGAGVGYYYEKNGRYGRILALSVDRGYRGRGIGSALVRETEVQLKLRGVGSVVVNSGAHRPEAHRFYVRLGYAETGVRFVKSL